MINSLVRLGPKRVFVIDDCLTALGLRQLFKGMLQEAEIMATTTNMRRAIDTIGKMPPEPDLVIADINLGRGVNLDGIKNLKSIYPHLRILILSAENEQTFATRSLRAGAIGFVSKMCKYDDLARQIGRALKGETVVSQEISNVLANHLVGNHKGLVALSPFDSLSDREHEVLSLLGEGHSTRNVAEHLHLSIKTIESHRAHLKEKLCLKNATELTRFAMLSRFEQT